jgi:hypothetical protein
VTLDQKNRVSVPFWMCVEVLLRFSAQRRHVHAIPPIAGEQLTSEQSLGLSTYPVR